MQAAYEPKLEMVEWLLNQGVSVNQTSDICFDDCAVDDWRCASNHEDHNITGPDPVRYPDPAPAPDPDPDPDPDSDPDVRCYSVVCGNQ